MKLLSQKCTIHTCAIHTVFKLTDKLLVKFLPPLLSDHGIARVHHQHMRPGECVKHSSIQVPASEQHGLMVTMATQHEQPNAITHCNYVGTTPSHMLKHIPIPIFIPDSDLTFPSYGCSLWHKQCPPHRP